METPKLRDRTHNCNELRIENINETVTLMGWINNIRPFGGALFIDIRDRYGNTQLVFQDEKDPKLKARASELRYEDVIAVTGVVISRGENKTDKVPTGDIEVEVKDFMVFSKSEVPPLKMKSKSVNINCSKRYNALIDFSINILSVLACFVDTLLIRSAERLFTLIIFYGLL